MLQALTALSSAGVFSSAVIKKRRYWPRYVEGDAIDKHFEGKAVGMVETLPGKLEGVDFKIMSMKEEDYVMKLMTTYYGSAVEVDDDGATQRTVTENGLKVTKHFKYTETFYNHFKFQHQVDDHNNLRHAPISFDASVNTKDWKIRAFTFIIALVEVNAKLAWSRFCCEGPTVVQIEFRRTLAEELLEFSTRTPRGRQKRSQEAMCNSVCGEETAPQFDGHWTGTEWTRLNTMYAQHVCRTFNCNRRIRTYCRCNVGHWMCSICIGIHIASRDNGNGVED